MYKYIPTVLLFLFASLEANCSEFEKKNSELNLNAYIDTLANTNISFRTDFHILSTNEEIPFGYFEDISPLIGHFIFRSKRINELSPATRDALLQSPGYVKFCSDHVLHLAISPTELLSETHLTLSF